MKIERSLIERMLKQRDLFTAIKDGKIDNNLI